MGSLILVGLFSFVYFTGLSFLVSLVGCFLVCVFNGIYSSASQGLNLEQLPELRGSVMSLVSAFGSVGNVLGLSVGGVLLVWYGWGILGGLGLLFSVVGFIVLSLFAIEPE
jgi:MFS family permease